MSEKVDTTSRDMLSDQLERFSAIFPQFMKEGKVDTEAVRAFFDEAGLSAGDEKYGLSWAGKSDAFRAIRMPSTGTLAPHKDESRDWDGTGNVFIEGDNLEVLKLLQKRYYGAVKMIYIDPPYNTGKDFVYRDNFTESVADYYERTGQSEGGIRLSANTEKNGRYHSDWLTMMYPRLFLAKNLLREDGVIFVSIDDNEVANLRLVMDEIFGEENFVAQLIWNKQHSQQQGVFKAYHEYVLVYSRNAGSNENIVGGEGEIIAGALKKISRANPESEFPFPAGTRVETKNDYELMGTYGNNEKVTVVSGKFIVKNGELAEDVVLSAGWTQKNQMKSWFAGQETVDSKGQKVLEFYFNSEGKLKCRKERSKITPPTILPLFGMVSEQTEALKEILDGYFFENPKPVEMLKLFVSWFSSDDDIILDFFAGSGTTAHAVMAQNAEDGGNRKWICVQIPEETDEASEAYKAGYKTISAISRERIRRAGEKIASSVVDPLRPSDTSPSTEGEGTSSPARGEVASLRADGEGMDTGFKAYTLAPSNYRKWHDITAEDDEETLRKQIALFAEKPLVDSFGEEGVVYEVLVKEGFDLNASVATSEAGGMKVWTITDGDRKLVATFANAVSRAAFDALGLSPADTFVCLDSALDDTTKLNLARSVNLKTI